MKKSINSETKIRKNAKNSVTFYLDDEEVTISVKPNNYDHRCALRQTLSMLNHLSCLFGAAAEWYQLMNLGALARSAEKSRSSAYNVCKSFGIYDED